MLSYEGLDGKGGRLALMPENNAAAERRTHTRAAVERLLEQRQQMLVQFERVSGVQPFDDDAPGAESLERFVQLLMDYIAAGHFGLYQRITEGTERRKAVIDAAERVFPKIAATMDRALDFNDAYDTTDKSAPFDALSDRLSRLGEVIALRVELEDELLSAMLAPPGEA